MTLLLNPNLLKHQEVSTASLNNLCTIMHKVPVEGSYSGAVFSDGDQKLGDFTLVYDKADAAAQVQIDLSAFDSFTQINLNKTAFAETPVFRAGGDGIVVFFISGTHASLYTTISSADKTVVFDSRKLNKGDAAIFRLIAEGDYVITDSQNQTMGVTVNAPVNGKYAPVQDQQPIVVKLDASGFTPAVAAIDPLQVIVVSIEVPATLNLTKSTVE